MPSEQMKGVVMAKGVPFSDEALEEAAAAAAAPPASA